MSLPGPNYVSESKGAPDQVKHMAIRRDKSFAGQLARAVSGDRHTRSVVFGKGEVGILAIDATAGSVDNPASAAHSHCFQDVLGKISAFPEIDVRLSNCFGDVRVSGEMEDSVAPGHGRGNRALLLQVGSNDFHTGVARAPFEMR